MTEYKKIRSYYDQYGEFYEIERNQTYYYDIINTIEINALEPYIRNKRILEIGCGTGIILQSSSRLAKLSAGIDLSLGMLAVAERKGLNILNANAVDIPFKNDTFDVIYSFKVLPHIPDLNDVIREIHRLLKPGGTAILEFYNPWSYKFLTNFLMGSKYKVFTRFHTPQDISKMTNNYFVTEKLIGARTVTPFAFALKLPFIGNVLRRFEYRVSQTRLNRFSGYLIFVLRKI